MSVNIHTIKKRILFHLGKPYRRLYENLTELKFPDNPSSIFRVHARLSQALSDIKSSDLHHNIGTLYPKADRFALGVYTSFLRFNPNNLGNWSAEQNRGGTRQLEYELIHKLIDLYDAKKENLEGYVTGGGTEGNLYSVWLGKSYLLKYVNLDEICMFRTQLTHYSIDKAGSICSIPIIEVPLNPTTWNMDGASLEQILLTQIKCGKRGFILSLTIGYTETGTSDTIKNICRVVNFIKKRHKNIYVSIIIDAAFDGLVLPFVTDDFHPFEYKDVHAFSVDFSKFTAVPYPAGVVLYRNSLRKLIEKEVPVFSMRDNTITGSRPGAPVAAIWAVIHRFGKTDFATIIKTQLSLKFQFIEQIKTVYPEAIVITNPNSLTCGIILHPKKTIRFSNEIEKKYWLFAKKNSFIFSNGEKKSLIIYKFFFMQHVSKKSICDFFADIQRQIDGKQY